MRALALAAVPSLPQFPRSAPGARPRTRRHRRDGPGVTQSQQAGWVKNPALILPGHRVTIAVAPQARGRAALLYVHNRRHSKSHAIHRRVTFFSGGFVAAAYPACVPLDITPDKGRRRRVNISLGAGGSP